MRKLFIAIAFCLLCSNLFGQIILIPNYQKVADIYGKMGAVVGEIGRYSDNYVLIADGITIALGPNKETAIQSLNELADLRFGDRRCSYTMVDSRREVFTVTPTEYFGYNTVIIYKGGKETQIVWNICETHKKLEEYIKLINDFKELELLPL